MDTSKEIIDFINKIIPQEYGVSFDDIKRPDDGSQIKKDMAPFLSFSLDILRDKFDLDMKTIARAFGFVHSQVVYYGNKSDRFLNQDHAYVMLHKSMVERADQIRSQLSYFEKKSTARVTDHNWGNVIKANHDKATEAKLTALTKGRLQRVIYLMDINASRWDVQESCLLTHKMYRMIKENRDQIINDNYKYVLK